MWLVGAMFISAVTYALNYSASTQALTFLAGAVIGQGMAVWAGFQSRKQKAESGSGFVLLVVVLFVMFLAVASFWRSELAPGYEYHGQARWSGPWTNPNIYGLLMGAGMVLAVGTAVRGWRIEDGRWKKSLCVVLSSLAAILLARGLWHSYSRGAWVAAACGLAYLAGEGINCEIRRLRAGNFLRSSRGDEAHLSESEIGKQKAENDRVSFLLRGAPQRRSGATAARRLLPGIRIFRFSGDSSISWFQKNWLPLSVVLFSVVVLGLSQFRQSDWLPARRVFSATNVNDFSWRNRVVAWEGALQMVADKPWFGFGWNQPERMYNYYYRPAKVEEAAAIQMNDYLTLGASVGLPALSCFAIYLWLTIFAGRARHFRRRPAMAGQAVRAAREQPDGGAQGTDAPYRHPASILDLQSSAWLAATCRAGAIVLAIGFWFDGGLFKVATASTFWILLELGRADVIPQKATEATETKPAAA